jgi:hypothetical protein
MYIPSPEGVLCNSNTIHQRKPSELDVSLRPRMTSIVSANEYQIDLAGNGYTASGKLKIIIGQGSGGSVYGY